MSLSGYNVRTRIAPKFGLRVLALFDGSVKMILPAVGKEIKADNSKVVLYLILNTRAHSSSHPPQKYSSGEKYSNLRYL